MATVDIRNADEYFWGYGVGFGREVLATSTVYVWNTFGASGNTVYLYGSGITSAGGVPTGGTIDEIHIDLSGDGFLGASDVDITITGISLPLVDLTTDDDVFWETVLAGNDTAHVFYNDPATNISFMFGDGITFTGSAGTSLSNDTLDATGTLGNVEMWGDYQTIEDATVISGNDLLKCDSATGGVSAIGDAESVTALGGNTVILAGDDVIDITNNSGNAIEHLIGDVETVAPATTANLDITVVGGDDTITNNGSSLAIYIAGDVYEQLAAGPGVFSAILGGDDEISGSSDDERIAGDVYHLLGGTVTGGDDYIEAGGGDDDIAGDVLVHSGGTFTGGDDVIDGGLGNDTIDGQDGSDTAEFLSNALSVVVVLGNHGHDGSAEGQGSDILRSIENVIGSEEGDTITGNGEANIVLAADGDDSVSGRSGADSLFGLYGNDTLSGGSGDDQIDGGADIDWVDFSSAGNGVTGDLASGLFAAAGTDTVANVENIIGSRHPDDLGGDKYGNSIEAGLGADILRGKEGDDTLTGEAGDDTVHGGDGNDTLIGGDNADLLKGENNNDVIEGGAGDDTLHGGKGNDEANYAIAANAVTVDLSLTNAQDTGEGTDTLTSIENIVGSSFDDSLQGNNENNVITGGSGVDTVTGGEGADMFVFSHESDSGAPGVYRDNISDFVHLTDKIDVSAIDAQTSTPDDDDFEFIGTDTFSAEGQIKVSQDGSDTIIDINTTGADGRDSSIRLVNFTATELTADDFIL